MEIKAFVESYKAKTFMSTPQGLNDKAEWIREQLKIKKYIPFMEKRKIAEMVVEQNIEVVDGIKKYDKISAYISLIMASIIAHTSLECSDDPISDYDLLAESGLLPEVLATFAGSHQEIDLLVHMALDMELEDNQINAIIGRLSNKISGTLDVIVDTAKDKFEKLDLSKVLGADFSEEDLTTIRGFLNKMK